MKPILATPLAVALLADPAAGRATVACRLQHAAASLHVFAARRRP